MSYVNATAIILSIGLVGLGTAGCTPDTGVVSNIASSAAKLCNAAKPTGRQPDLSGCKRVGMASFYARMFAGRTMANGNVMDPHGDNAASKTLPLGTTARVTNIETGQSAVVTIQDRGPYVRGRIVDLSATTAQQIGITHESGIAKVQVVPITIPLPDGSLKRGVAASDAAR